jgi:hypothetical protein
MTHDEFAVWAKKRTQRLQAQRYKDKYHRKPSFKKVANQKRVRRRQERDPDNLARRNWYLAHAEQEKASARERRAAAIRSNPDRARQLKNAQQRRRYARRKIEKEIAAICKVTPEIARFLLTEAKGDAALVLGKEQSHIGDRVEGTHA